MTDAISDILSDCMIYLPEFVTEDSDFIMHSFLPALSYLNQNPGFHLGIFVNDSQPQSYT